ncbi:MAG: hypothetical protein ABSG92_05690 [Conexivisphaerales archaeon]
MSEPLDKPTDKATAVGEQPTTNRPPSKGGRSSNRPAKEGTDQGKAEETPKGGVEKAEATKGPDASQERAEGQPEQGTQQGERLAPLNEEERQTIYSLLHQGKAQRFIREAYGDGRAETINKMADELKEKKVVLYEGRWEKAEEVAKHDTEKAGESAATAAATAVIGSVTTETATRAVAIQAELMRLGTHVRDNYIGTATQDAQTLEEFLQAATDFYLMYKETV